MNTKYILMGIAAFTVLMVYLLGFYHYAGAHYQKCHEDCIISPVPDLTPIITPVEQITPTDAPSATPSATPTDAPVRTDISSGLSDGKSDGRSSCPSCTAAPDNYPKSNYDNSVVGWK